MKWTILGVIGFASLLTTGCAKPQGSEGGDCYPNATCNPGLMCLSNLCVGNTAQPTMTSGGGGGTNRPIVVATPTGAAPTGATTGASTGTSNGGSSGTVTGPDLGACNSCGQAACTAEANACQAANGCSAVLDCWLACTNDTSCVNACDVSSATADGLQQVSNYFSCLAVQCTSECSASPGGTGTTTPGSAGTTSSGAAGAQGTGEACVSGTDTDRGSCLDMSYQICEGAEWLVGDCTGCGVVTPSATCIKTSAFTLQEEGDELVGVPEAETTYTQAADSVRAEWYLESGQTGTIQFVLSEPISPGRVEIEHSGRIEFVTIENDDGSGGCQYTVESDGRLSRYVITDVDGEGIQYVAWYGCWGSYETLESNEPTTASVLNIRTPVVSTNDLVTLTVSTILL